MSGRVDYDQFDLYLGRRVLEGYLLKEGVSLESIKQMSDKNVQEYAAILGAFQEMENEQMGKGTK